MNIIVVAFLLEIIVVLLQPVFYEKYHHLTLQSFFSYTMIHDLMDFLHPFIHMAKFIEIKAFSTEICM